MKITILRGLPGSGKSAYVLELGIDPQFVVSADNYRLDAYGNYHFDPDKSWDCHVQCFTRFISLVNWHTPPEHIVVDNTNMALWEMSPYVMVAASKDCEVEVHHFNVSPSVSAKRNTHNVPVDSIWEMLKAYESLPKKWGITQIEHYGE